jgi:hypothetical protein
VGALPGRPREDVEVGERELCDERPRRRVVVIRLAREARDDVGAQAERSETRGDLEHPAPIPLARVPAPHPAQHRVAPALHRHVQVRSEQAVRPGEQIHQRVVDLRRLDRAQPEPDPGGRLQQAGREAGERRLPRQVPAEVPDVDSGEHELGVRLRQQPGLGDDLVRGSRAARAPREPRGAERAPAVAAVLHLQPAAGAPPVRAQQRRADRLLVPVPQVDARRRREGHRDGIVPLHHVRHLRHRAVL